MLRQFGQICTRFSILLALSLGGCGPGTKSPDSANNVVPLNDKPSGAASNASSADSHTPSADVSRAMKQIEAKQFAEAKEILTKSIVASPNDVLAHYYLGVACSGLGDTEGASASYKRAIEIDKKFAEAYVNLSALQLDLKDASGALATADAGLKSANSADLYLNRAIALEALGKKDESVAAYGLAVKNMPDNLSLRVTYAQLLASGGKKDEALAQVRRVRDGDDPEITCNCCDLGQATRSIC